MQDYQKTLAIGVEQVSRKQLLVIHSTHLGCE